ncbi:MAG: hypothetical protein M1827_003356 [Pycnora praestabilis]|nr:MAG: hypothetical protein M1827_003356 [Pycnora praestabilis]
MSQSIQAEDDLEQKRQGPTAPDSQHPFDRSGVHSFDNPNDYVSKYTAGEKVELKVRRNGIRVPLALIVVEAKKVAKKWEYQLKHSDDSELYDFGAWIQEEKLSAAPGG